MYEVINFIRNNKRASIIALIVTLALLAFSGFRFTTNRLFPPNIELVTAPSDAKLSIKGKSYSKGKTYLEPGTYKITASREGFKSLTQEVKVIEEMTVVTFALTPSSREGKEIARSNVDLYSEVERQGGEAAAVDGQRFRRANPIVSVLPYQGILYDISYRVDEADESNVIITINTRSSEDRAFALDRIKNWGYDPADYQIEFGNFDNPLGRNSDAL